MGPMWLTSRYECWYENVDLCMHLCVLSHTRSFFNFFLYYIFSKGGTTYAQVLEVQGWFVLLAKLNFKMDMCLIRGKGRRGRCSLFPTLAVSFPCFSFPRPRIELRIATMTWKTHWPGPMPGFMPLLLLGFLYCSWTFRPSRFSLR